jgi:hypothetical protein
MKMAGIFLSVLVLIIWAVTAYGAIDETMVLALSFDEGQGKTAEDSSQYGFDGKIDGAEWVDGKFGKALEFDGAAGDVVAVADTPELLLLEGGTLMAWSYIMTEAGHASWPRIIIKSINNGGTTNGYDFLFDRAGGYSIRFCVGGECNSHFPMETDAWHHVAITFEGPAGGAIRVYADGEQVGEAAQIGDVVDSTGFDVHIGNGAAFDRPYHGRHDEVRIWNRPLDEDEIKWQMERTTKEVVAVEPHLKLATTWAEVKNE